MAAIYSISSIRNPARFYIGSAVNPPERWKRHISELRKCKHCNNFLQNHYNAWGEGDFLFTIVEECETDQLIVREQFYIDSLKPPFNLCQIAGSRQGLPIPFATRDKLKKSWKRRTPISMESRLKKPRC